MPQSEAGKRMYELPVLQPQGEVILRESLRPPWPLPPLAETRNQNRGFVEYKMFVAVDQPGLTDDRGRFTVDKVDGPPEARKAAGKLQPVLLAPCEYFSRRVRRRFCWPPRDEHDKTPMTFTRLVLRGFNAGKTQPTAGLVRMLLAASAREAQRRPRFKLGARRTAWLDRKPLVALESTSSLQAHLAVEESASERSRRVADAAMIQTAQTLKRWKYADDKQHRPAITLLDESARLYRARARRCSAATWSPSRKGLLALQQTREIAAVEPNRQVAVTGASKHWDRLQSQHVREARAALYADGRVWERRITQPVPAFVPASDRRAKIVTVRDVSGGDGKTTLASQLVAQLTAQGDRVLVVDLDYHGAMSSRYFSQETRSVLRAAKRTVVGWLERFACRDGVPEKCMRRVRGALYAAPADESLGVWEARERAAWLVQPDGGDDVRFRLRGVLHSREISQRFDWIVLDCPARLSTAAMNALTASDHLLLSAAPGETSRALVGQLLGWLARLNVLTGACRGLSLLGVVDAEGETADRSSTVPRTQPRRVVNGPDTSADPRWRDGVYHFTTQVPTTAKVAHAARRHQGAAPAQKAHRGRLDNLAQELKDRVAARGKRF